MIRYLLFFLLMLLPTISFGNRELRDGCIENGKYKSEYTIDRRCYVTDEQKKQTPYNAVVGIINNKNEIFCTGTIFRDNETVGNISRVEGAHVFTAAHCVKNKPQQMRIRLQNNKEIIAEKVNIGTIPEERTFVGWDNRYKGFDWAVYKIPENEQNNVNYVDIDTKKTSGRLHGPSSNQQIKVIGYGAASIMSDKEIKNYRLAYIEFLKTEKINEIAENDKKCENLKGSDKYDDCLRRIDNMNMHLDREVNWLKQDGEKVFPYFSPHDGAMGVMNDPRANKYFIKFTKEHPLEINVDTLKESLCYIGSDKDFCQVWGGNSGGGIFVNNKLMGIVSQAASGIGGSRHMAFLDKKDDGAQRAVWLNDDKESVRQIMHKERTESEPNKAILK